MNSFYKLIEGLDLIYSNLYSFLSFYSNTAVEHLRLPRFYYINISKELISIIVFDKFVYKSLLSHIFVMLNNFSLTRFIKLRVKGLGYEVRECTSNIHAFCFN